MGKHAATHELMIDDPSEIGVQRILFSRNQWFDIYTTESRTWIGSNNGRLVRDWGMGVDLYSSTIQRVEIAGVTYTVKPIHLPMSN